MKIHGSLGGDVGREWIGDRIARKEKGQQV